MASHRYWRLLGTTLYNDLGPSTPPAEFMLSGLEIRATPGGANIAIPGNGASMASANGADYEHAKAFDSTLSTIWYSSGSTGDRWVGWDFGSGNAQDLDSGTFTIINAPSNPLCVTGGSLQYSDDNVSWIQWAAFGDRTNVRGASSVHVYTPPGSANAALAAPPPGVLSFGGASLFLTPPAATISGSFGGHSSIVAPASATASFGGATASITAPAPTLYSAGRSSVGDNDFTYTAPSALLSARGGVNARLSAPSPALTTTATFTNWGKSDINAPSATLSATGTVSGTGQANLTFNDPYKLVGYSGAVASITLTGGYTVQAQGKSGSIGGAAITCPLFELTATATRQNSGSANLLAPAARLGAQAQAWLAAPGFQLTAIGTAVVVPTYEAYAVNLLHRNTDAPVNEATRYTNFPFTHVVRYKNSYYGANSTGLYLLEGTTDDGAAIPWEFKTTITDFESPMGKTAVSAYFAGRMGPEATVGIHLGESGDVSYSHTTPRGPAAQNYRQVFGLGLKSHYYALSVAGEGVMELDAVEFNNKTLTRRI